MLKTMKISTDIKPVTQLKSRAAELLNQVNETHRPIIITQNGEPRAVLQDPESFENMRNAIGLLKLIAQGEEDIQNGRTIPQDEVFANLEQLTGLSNDTKTWGNLDENCPLGLGSDYSAYPGG